MDSMVLTKLTADLHGHLRMLCVSGDLSFEWLSVFYMYTFEHYVMKDLDVGSAVVVLTKPLPVFTYNTLPR